VNLSLHVTINTSKVKIWKAISDIEHAAEENVSYSTRAESHGSIYITKHELSGDNG